MKLYSYPPAPSPQRVHFFMKEKGIDLPVEVVDMMAAAQLGDAYKAVNPRGTSSGICSISKSPGNARPLNERP